MRSMPARLQRQLTAIESQGMIDPASGLFTIPTFLRETWPHRRRNAGAPTSLSVAARLTCIPTVATGRVDLDAARQTSRLYPQCRFRTVRQATASILLTRLRELDLQSGHVVAQRIVGALKSTSTATDRNQRPRQSLCSNWQPASRQIRFETLLFS